MYIYHDIFAKHYLRTDNEIGGFKVLGIKFLPDISLVAMRSRLVLDPRHIGVESFGGARVVHRLGPQPSSFGFLPPSLNNFGLQTRISA
jgi:hypothetical protein